MCFHCGNDTWFALSTPPEVCGKISIGTLVGTSVRVEISLPLRMKASLFQYTLDESRFIFGAVFHYRIRPLYLEVLFYIKFL